MAAEAAERKNRLRRLPGVAEAGRALDPVIHERVRLSILGALRVASPMSFVELTESLGLSAGNLSVHARKLEEAGYVSCEKRFEGRVPRTEYQITARGTVAFDAYVDHMEALIRATRTPR